MQYLGGKWAARNRIAAHVLSHGLPVFEPFVGGANLPHLWPAGSLCADVDAGLIDLYRKVQAEGVDWIPEVCTEAEYRESMARTDERPIDTFRLVACSFGGKKRGGYARNTQGRNYARQGRNSLKRLIGLDVQFHALDFLTLAPFGGCVLYCDPPYAATTGYKSGAFDHGRFVARVREWSRFCPVYVSEYEPLEPSWVECDITHNKPGATLAKKHDRLFLVR